MRDDATRPVPLQPGALPPLLIARREFMRGAAAGAFALPGIAGPFARGAGGSEEGVTSPDHHVPVDKKLDPAWVRALPQRGEPTVRRGEQRAACAMPVGGIGCGQLYAGSDGTLRGWELFNRHTFTGWGQKNYEFTIPARVVEHGFAVALRGADGRWRVRRLREEDAPDVEFLGQHPVAAFTYPPRAAGGADDAADFPIDVKLEIFAPFIPGNAPDSTLPVTFLRVTLASRGARPLEAVLLSWLENVAAPDSGDRFGGVRSNRIDRGPERAVLDCRIDPPAADRDAAAPPEVFADFEGGTWGAWKVEGSAFGAAPSQGTEPGQQAVTGFQGRGLANSYRPDDRPTGTLTSPEFTIRRRFINFLIGGGSHVKESCLDLVVGGEVVASATGKGSEALQWDHFDVLAHAGRPATLRIVDRTSAGWGHVSVDQIEFADTPRRGPGGTLPTQSDFGTLHWIALAPGVAGHPDWRGPLEEAAAQAADGGLADSPPHGAPWERRDGRPVGLLALRIELPPAATVAADHALVWDSRNAANGHWYAARFPDAAALVDHVVKERERLIADTLAWRDLYHGGSLPYWLLERLHAPVANLQTNVTQVWKSGRFWAWEGVGCCEGTCTHVWNYEHATGRLYPELARSTREQQDLGAGFHEDGLVGYRGAGIYAADGQCGTVLKCWREHLMSADDAFLRRNWPRIRKAVEFLLRRDGDEDGLLEDDQHNTYDVRFFGANTFVGSLYLAALRAAEEMAKLSGDLDFAARCRRVFESGRRLTVERLWNGEYFFQQVDPARHPADQYGDGCLADQLFGQGWARQVGLGDLYPVDHVRTALRSVWRYCWAPDVGPQNARHLPERYFARRGEAGLFTCTWPKSRHLGERGVRYRDEVWSGIEYQVAGHMIWEGMVEEGLAILRGIHERYDGRVHNPWNEIECGDHYARAMASWGCYLALLGFEHDGPAGMVGFAPRLRPERFSAAFTSAQGWGGFVQIRSGGQQSNALALVRGSLALRELRLDLPAPVGRFDVSVACARAEDRRATRPVACELRGEDRRAALRLADPLELRAGDALHVDFRKT